MSLKGYERSVEAEVGDEVVQTYTLCFDKVLSFSTDASRDHVTIKVSMKYSEDKTIGKLLDDARRGG